MSPKKLKALYKRACTNEMITDVVLGVADDIVNKAYPSGTPFMPGLTVGQLEKYPGWHGDKYFVTELVAMAQGRAIRHLCILYNVDIEQMDSFVVADVIHSTDRQTSQLIPIIQSKLIQKYGQTEGLTANQKIELETIKRTAIIALLIK